MIGRMRKTAPRLATLTLLGAMAMAMAMAGPALAGSDARLDLAGMSPGQTPRQAASGFLRELPTLTLTLPEDAPAPRPTASESLAADCAPMGPLEWSCKALFAGAAPDPAATEVELQFFGKSVASDRELARARLAMNWEAPSPGVWEAFKAKRPAPNAEGRVATRKALEAFAESPQALSKASAAASFKAARWLGYADDGSPTELVAIAALDGQDRTLALLAETSVKGWGPTMRAGLNSKASSVLP